ncbi:MAG: outer membrane lipoprotein carrier protein LolA [Neisseriaceae bacterium]|nr:outer membrane lipoprotein carrier protein LolA [Neisseriaceae bacterium]
MIKKLFLTTTTALFSLTAFAITPDEIAANMQKSQVVSGKFTQNRHLRGMDKPMQTQGQFALAQNHGLLWQVETPLTLKLRLTQNGVEQWNNPKNQWIKSKQAGQSAQFELFTALLGGNISVLNQHFTPKANGSPQNWTLTLEPKSAMMKQIFTQISVQGGNTVSQVILQEKQGDKVEIQFIADTQAKTQEQIVRDLK